MKYKPNSSLSWLIGLIVTALATISGCDLYVDWRNDPPKINSFTVPQEVHYGETVEFKVSVFEPEDDTVTYVWDVSSGVLKATDKAIVEWTAPAPPDENVVPPQTVNVHLSVQDGGEEEATKSATIIVYSKTYQIADGLRGDYELVRTQVNGETVESLGGTMRLTTTTFTRQFEDDAQFFSGAYQLVEPFNQNKGTINWYHDGIQQLTSSTYTWDGRLLVLYWEETLTTHVYEKRN